MGKALGRVVESIAYANVNGKLGNWEIKKVCIPSGNSGALFTKNKGGS